MAETVLIYGDSNVAGWRPDAPKLFKKGETWASMLAAKLDATVVVDGLPGRALVHNLDTPEADYQRFKKVCNQAGNISLLILMIGVNDFALNNGAMTVISHINEYIRLSNAKHTIYVPHPGICYERLPKMFEYFTKEHCEPIFREFSGNLGRINATILQLERQYCIGEDGLHLSAEGHQYVASKVYETVIEITRADYAHKHKIMFTK